MADEPSTAPLPRLAVGAGEAAAMLGIGRTLFLQGDRTGEIGPVALRIGGRRLWSVEELAEWVRHSMPPRSRWAEIWPGIASQSQGSAGNGACGSTGHICKGYSVCGGDRP